MRTSPTPAPRAPAQVRRQDPQRRGRPRLRRPQALVGTFPQHDGARGPDGQSHAFRDEDEDVLYRPELAWAAPEGCPSRLEEALEGIPSQVLGDQNVGVCTVFHDETEVRRDPVGVSLQAERASVKAGIKYKSPATKRAQHIKRFMKGLRDKQPKAILFNQRFHDVDDLEYVPQQDKDLAQDGNYDMPPPKPRDFRDDNVHSGRFKPRRHGRVYVVQGEAESDAE
ncbi:unnamed protein product [Phytophthora fragariaefolia]|uniref:Unnamed protein product n=1 Tax=Phytophthora fragariaefolia TaxID=1490495 RepID=A0A9W6XLN8_9STRA|nr:unnamed protein product [Phytophthora fragariaefolia]